MSPAIDQRVVLGTLPTPLGPVSVVLTPVGVARCAFTADAIAHGMSWVRRWQPDAHVVQATTELIPLADELEAYFAGTLRSFSVPLDLRGTTFQRQVWQAVQQVAYGTVTTYGAIATAIGRPTATRAVGAANGANPVSILIPCHRLVAWNGELIRYGGGVERKRSLLRLEGIAAGNRRIHGITD